MNSNRPIIARKLLAEKLRVSIENHTHVRNYLIMHLALQNASRSGNLANLIVSEVDFAAENGDCRVIRMREHKTVSKYGSADLIIRKDVYKDVSNVL
jgi:hypothetical protein